MKIQYFFLSILFLLLGCAAPMQYGNGTTRMEEQKDLEWKVNYDSLDEVLDIKLERENVQTALLQSRIAVNVKKVDHSFHSPSPEGVSMKISPTVQSGNGWFRMRKLSASSCFVAVNIRYISGDSLYHEEVLSWGKGPFHKVESENYRDRFHILVIDEGQISTAHLFINGIFIPVGYEKKWRDRRDMAGPWHTICEDTNSFFECGIYGGFLNLRDLAHNYVNSNARLFFR